MNSLTVCLGTDEIAMSVDLLTRNGKPIIIDEAAVLSFQLRFFRV